MFTDRGEDTSAWTHHDHFADGLAQALQSLLDRGITGHYTDPFRDNGVELDWDATLRGLDAYRTVPPDEREALVMAATALLVEEIEEDIPDFFKPTGEEPDNLPGLWWVGWLSSPGALALIVNYVERQARDDDGED